ncbi:MAG: MBL fold metallo-hydrolase [Bacteroides sp.]|nr:MBL fold metallo-hydrolase [Bacteroides sp.]
MKSKEIVQSKESRSVSLVSLEYIFHDSFIFRFGNQANLLFDYWKEDADRFQPRYSEQSIPECLDSLDRAIPLYIFISHHHKDHYNQGIFRWINEFKHGYVIISKDVAKFSRHLIVAPELEGKIIVLRPGDVWKDDFLEVHAFGSTDIGNSYGMRIQGSDCRIFHAGDLNDWIWLDESTEKEVRQMEGNFKKILSDIKQWTDSWWLAMFPVDSRIGREYWRGAKIFLSQFKVEHFFPMHFELGETEQERASLKRDARAFELFASENCHEYIALQCPHDKWASILPTLKGQEEDPRQ